VTAASPKRRILAAVLFTDIVDSTSVAEELGDRRWKTLLDRHNAILRRELKRFGGRELDTAGDGFFVSFREPASAITCGCAATEAVRELGIEIRAGVHFGECERVGKKLAGITVVVGARITALGGPGDVFVSSTAAELARGGGFGFEDHGTHVLKGVEGEWRVFGVSAVDGRALAPVAEADEARARRDALVASEAKARWRQPVLLGVAGLAVLAGVGLTAMLTRGGEELELPGPDTIARIDSSRNIFDRVFSVGSNAYPQAIAAGEDKLWVVNAENKTLASIDMSRDEAQILGGMPSTPTGVAVEEGRVWITFGFSSDASRLGVLDPRRDQGLEAVPFPVPDGSYPITAGGESIWIVDPLGSTVIRYDPVSEKLHRLRLRPGSGPVDLAVSAEGSSQSVWVAAGREPTLFLIDAGHPKRPFKTFGTRGYVPTALAVGPDGSAWIASEGSDAVLAVTPSGTIRVERKLGGLCDGPADIAASRDAVWVSCGNSRRVVRLDPSDGSLVRELQVGGVPGALAVERGGAVWVAVRRGSLG
jgi:class 3 adenylate cyclase/DNA-binding beta-propeller fold protein YncE